MSKFTIPVWWAVKADVEVEAESLEEAIAEVRKDPMRVKTAATIFGNTEFAGDVDDPLSVDEILARELAYD